MRSLQSRFLRWWTLGLFFGVHAALEFFAYARGYGLLLAFMLGALWYLNLLYQQFKPGLFLWFVAFSFLALASNISALPLFGLLILASFYKVWQSAISQGQKIGLSILGSLPLAYSLWWSFMLRKHQQLYYGGEEGFLSDSLNSLKTMLLGSELSLDLFLAAGALFFIALVASKPWQSSQWNLAHGLALAFLLITAFYPLGNLLLGLKFPFDRALLYWLVFGLISFIALLDWHYQKGFKSLIFFSLWSLAFPLHLFGHLSLNRASFPAWSQEQVPTSFYHFLEKQNAENFGGSYLQAPQWNFLHQKQQGALPVFQLSDSPWLDYRLCEEKDLAIWLKKYEVKNSNEAGLYLLQRKPRTYKKEIASFESDPLENHKEGQPLVEGPLDGRYQAISADLKIKVDKPHKLAIAVQALNELGEQVYWQAYRARAYLSLEKDWQDWHLFVVLEDLPEDSQDLKIFFWNPENESFSLQKGNWTIWELN